MKASLPFRRAAFFTALLLTAASAAHADDAARLFLWDQANACMAAARTPGDFLEAARAYNRLASDGVRNGPLFYNLGTALLLAGDGENAAAALRRAERYLGSTPEIRTNFRQALALQTGQPETDLPWERIVFGWHYAEPLRVRAQIAWCGWLLLWSALLLRLLTHPSRAAGRLRAFANSCLFFGALIFTIFLASAAVSWLQEQADARTWGERVFAGKSVPEQAP